MSITGRPFNEAVSNIRPVRASSRCIVGAGTSPPGYSTASRKPGTSAFEDFAVTMKTAARTSSARRLTTTIAVNAVRRRSSRIDMAARIGIGPRRRRVMAAGPAPYPCPPCRGARLPIDSGWASPSSSPRLPSRRSPRPTGSSAPPARLWDQPHRRIPFRVIARVPAALEPIAGAVGIAIFAVLTYAGIAGSQDFTQNLAPTFIYVIFWVGIPIVSAFVGDIWKPFNPWRAIARAIGWALRRAGRQAGPTPLRAYPPHVGRWAAPRPLAD